MHANFYLKVKDFQMNIVIQILQSILAVITNVLLRLVLIPQLIAKLQELPKQSWLKIQAAMQYLDMASNGTLCKLNHFLVILFNGNGLLDQLHLILELISSKLVVQDLWHMMDQVNINLTKNMIYLKKLPNYY